MPPVGNPKAGCLESPHQPWPPMGGSPELTPATAWPPAWSRRWRVSSRVNVDDAQTSSEPPAPLIGNYGCWVAKASRSWSGVLCGRRRVLLRTAARAGFRAPQGRRSEVANCDTRGRDPGDLRGRGAEVEQTGEPLWAAPVLPSGGLLPHGVGHLVRAVQAPGPALLPGTRATAEEAYADVLAARAALAASG